MSSDAVNSRLGRRVAAGIAAAVCLAAASLAQESPESAAAGEEGSAPVTGADQFDKQSLALRTALHYDPSLTTPLEKLVALYRDADRIEELVTLYRTHITQYPADAGAHAVLIRVLDALRRPESSAMASMAVERHPEAPYLLYLRYRDLAAQRDPRAIDFLSQAIQHETIPARRRAWTFELVEQAAVEGRSDVAEDRLRELAEEPGQPAEQLLALAREMDAAGFDELALETIARAAAANPSPETSVDLNLEAAEIEAELGRTTEAAVRLDALLDKVALDYWRRSEIVIRRVNLVRSDAALDALLAEARARWEANPDSESAALDLAELLEAAELRRDALQVLRSAAASIPHSEPIERSLIELFDRTGDERGAAEYLEARLADQPGRLDLGYRLVKALYAIGKRDEARSRFDEILAQIGKDDQLRQQIEMGRYLRRMSMPGEAVEMFRAVVQETPERLDIRRELAESLIAAGDRRAAREQFGDDLPLDAEIENFLDIVQFMIGSELLAEARRAITQRLETDPAHFDLRLLLAEASGKMGDLRAGERALAQARELADTGARYARWLEAAVAFHDLFDTREGFFDAEQARLLHGADWTPELVGRFLTFSELAQRHHHEEMIADIVRRKIEDEAVPDDARSQLRQLLVRILDRSPDHVAEVHTHLKALAAEDEANIHAYNLRLAQIYHSANRPDLARPLLETVRFHEIGDASLIGGTHAILLDYGMQERALDALEQLTALEPSNLSSWEKWIALLAAQGRESRLRQALRQLAAGAGRAALSEETHNLLRSHLVDSYWRSISRLLADGGESSLRQILPMLDAIERTKRIDSETLWVLWTRAFVLGRLGREEARAQVSAALAERAEDVFARMTADAPAPGTDGESDSAAAAQPVPGEPASAEQDSSVAVPEGPMIWFPDGLALALDAGVAILEDQSSAAAAPRIVEETRGPGLDFGVDWVFQTNGLAAVAQILPLDDGGVLISDVAGTITRVSGSNGKVEWELENSVAPTIGRPAAGNRRHRTPMRSSRGGVVRYPSAGDQFDLPPRLVADGEGRILVPRMGAIECRDAATGALLWRTWLGEQLSASPVDPNGNPVPVAVTASPLVFIDRGRAVVYSPAAAAVFSFALETGKLLWTADLYEEDGSSEAPPSALGSGASLSHGYLLVFGQRPRILDAATGKTVWRFDHGRVREFPMQLRTADDAAALAGGSSWGTLGAQLMGGSSAAWAAPVPPQVINHFQPAESAGYRSRQFTESAGLLVAPAVDWAARLEQGAPSFAALHGHRMLLMGPEGVDVLSLDLPLAATRFAASGVYVGSSGSKSLFLDAEAKTLHIIHLGRQSMETVPLDEIGGDGAIDVCLTGARVYAAGRSGLVCFNVHTARKVFFSQWPDALADFLPQDPEILESSEEFVVHGSPSFPGHHLQTEQQVQIQSFWQGIAVSRGSTAPAICLPPRAAAAPDRLIAVLASGTVAALSSPASGAPVSPSSPSPSDPDARPSD